MSYADGVGLTMDGQSRREQLRLKAAEMFEPMRMPGSA
jgi:hypothetical protein